MLRTIVPRLFQMSADTSSNDGLESRYLVPGSPIVIRNEETKRFIRVESEKTSTLDMEAGWQDNNTGSFVRLDVG